MTSCAGPERRDPGLDSAGRVPDPAPPLLIGPGSLLESDDRPAWWTPPGAPHRLEALIGTPNGDGTLTVHHYFAAQHRPDSPWLRGDQVSAVALGPARIDQRGRAGTSRHELVAHVPEPDGWVEYAWAVNDTAPLRWRRIGVVTAPPTPERPAWDGPEGAEEWGVGAVLATATAATRLQSGWVQALVQVDECIYHLHRQQRGRRVRWFRHACLRLTDREPADVAAESSAKVAQVSGERDSQPTTGGSARRTLSASESRSGVRGTDLGVRIDHAGRTFMLFGDTHWTRPWLGTRDSLAEITDASADRPLVTFHGSPTAIAGGGTTLREYDVPVDAFSLDGELYAFFTSNHFRDGQVMGRSVLARAGALSVDPAARRRPLRFRHLAAFSSHRFVNVSAQRIGDQLYLWGSGAYRADDLRLARVDLATPGLADALRKGNAGPFQAAVRYWAGPPVEARPTPVETQSPPVDPVETGAHPVSTSSTDGHPGSTVEPVWSTRESAARPLLTPGAHGEVSVRWVPELDRYLMLTMSGPEDPIGAAVLLRTAPQPWGPWSPRLRLLDWVAVGMSFDDPSQRFIRASSDGSDPVGDATFRGQANATGAAYAPYFYDVRRQGDVLVLRYTLSTWNPYQVVLMRHRLQLGVDLPPVPPDR